MSNLKKTQTFKKKQRNMRIDEHKERRRYLYIAKFKSFKLL